GAMQDGSGARGTAARRIRRSDSDGFRCKDEEQQENRHPPEITPTPAVEVEHRSLGRVMGRTMKATQWKLERMRGVSRNARLRRVPSPLAQHAHIRGESHDAYRGD